MGEFPLCSGTRRETRLCDLAARGFRHGLPGGAEASGLLHGVAGESRLTAMA